MISPTFSRLRLNNAGADDAVVLGIWYSNPQRLDIHYQGEYIPALNMELNAKGKYDTKAGIFMPTVDMALGEIECLYVYFIGFFFAWFFYLPLYLSINL